MGVACFCSIGSVCGFHTESRVHSGRSEWVVPPVEASSLARAKTSQTFGTCRCVGTAVCSITVTTQGEQQADRRTARHGAGMQVACHLQAKQGKQQSSVAACSAVRSTQLQAQKAMTPSRSPSTQEGRGGGGGEGAKRTRVCGAQVPHPRVPKPNKSRRFASSAATVL